MPVAKCEACAKQALRPCENCDEMKWCFDHNAQVICAVCLLEPTYEEK